MTDVFDLPPDVYDAWDASCPFVAVQDDESTRFAYPSLGNFCHGYKPPKGLPLDWQAKYCLSENHSLCTVYRDILAKERDELSPAVPPRRRRRGGAARRWSAALALLGIFSLVAVLYLGFPVLQSFWIKPTPSLAAPAAADPELTQAALAAALVEASPTPAPTLMHTPTSTPQPTPTASPIPPTPTVTPVPPTATAALPTPGPGMGTPFGPGQAYILHSVSEGESLYNLALVYNTNLDVIQAANVLKSGTSIWPGNILVILPGEQEAEGVPRFQVIFLEEETSIAEVVRYNDVTATELRLYNSLGPDEWISAGRWLIIPLVD